MDDRYAILSGVCVVKKEKIENPLIGAKGHPNATCSVIRGVQNGRDAELLRGTGFDDPWAARFPKVLE
jgi:hypothetical protein